ncbi:MAG: phosphatase PAP2 family protein [Pseudonocardiales bacterium]
MAEELLVDEQRLKRWRRIRRSVAACYFAVLAWIVVADGVPTGRLNLMIIIVAGLAITSLGHGWRRLLQVVLDWLPFTLVLIVYDLSRGVATAVNLPLHEKDIASAESWLFGGNVPTVWMQNEFYTPAAVHWYDAVATLVYTTHFLATPILAAILWLRNRAVWLAYITRVIVLAFAGLLTYVLFPEAPPWLAARDGLIDPVARLSARGWIWMHAGNVHRMLDAAQRDGSNPVAAMPSLHVAFATLVALCIASRLAGRLRYLLALYPIAMGAVLVYTGEHYVLDLIVGVAYALGVNVVVSRWERRRRSSAPSDAEREPVPVA